MGFTTVKPFQKVTFEEIDELRREAWDEMLDTFKVPPKYPYEF